MKDIKLLTIQFEIGENLDKSDFIEIPITKKQSQEIIEKLKMEKEK